MSLDLKFCAALLSEETPRAVLNAGIRSAFLFDKGRSAFQVILAHVRKHGTMPQPETVEAHPDVGVKLPEAKEPLSFYIEQLKERRLDNVACVGLGEAVEQMKQMDTLGAVEAAKRMLHAMQREALLGEPIIDLADTVDDLIEEYERAKQFEGGIDGIPTPWPLLNEYTQGFHAGELWVIVGRLGIGKTFCLIRMWLEARRNDAPCAFISLEMPANKIARRFHACYAEVSYPDLKRGQLGLHAEETYRMAMRTLKLESGLYVPTRKQIKTVGDVALLIEQVNPEVVFIDGAYKLRVEGWNPRAAMHERMSMLFDGLQELAEVKDVAIVVTSQLNRKVSGKATAAGTENLAFADTIGQNADVILALFQTQMYREDRTMLHRLLKNREDDRVDYVTRWDFDSMDFAEIGRWQPEAESGGEIQQTSQVAWA